MTTHHWTEPDKVYIRKHYKQHSSVEMAVYFGVKPNTMRTQLWHMGLRRFEKKVGEPCPPAALDLMHRETYQPPKSFDFTVTQEGLIDPRDCPSRGGPETNWKYDRGHA